VRAYQAAEEEGAELQNLSGLWEQKGGSVGFWI